MGSSVVAVVWLLVLASLSTVYGTEPLGTKLVLVAFVSKDVQANDDYWRAECKSIPEDGSALFIRLKMGDVEDYFMPVEGASWCEMLTSCELGFHIFSCGCCSFTGFAMVTLPWLQLISTSCPASFLKHLD
jgi:hypothetical protein